MLRMFPYRGAKWRLASKYGAPRYRTVIEPFAGSAGYSLYYDVEKAILYDINPYVVETWEYLIGASPEDIATLPIDGFSSTEELNVPLGAKYLIGYWLRIGEDKPAVKGSSWWKKYRDLPVAQVWSSATRDRICQQVDNMSATPPKGEETCTSSEPATSTTHCPQD